MSRTPVSVSDELFAKLREHFDERQLVELTNVIAIENMRGRFNLALGIGSAGFSEGMVCVTPEALHAGPRRDRQRGQRGVRVFLAGATGVIGAPCCACWSAGTRGHRQMRRPSGRRACARAGAEAAIADALDAEAVSERRARGRARRRSCTS